MRQLTERMLKKIKDLPDSSEILKRIKSNELKVSSGQLNSNNKISSPFFGASSIFKTENLLTKLKEVELTSFKNISRYIFSTI
jgi:hypothetical protein